jgi:hypothetical protein
MQIGGHVKPGGMRGIVDDPCSNAHEIENTKWQTDFLFWEINFLFVINETLGFLIIRCWVIRLNIIFTKLKKFK